MADWLIQARGMQRSFGEVQAVAGVDLVVAAGEIYGLVGPDGAGKTTLIRMLCGALAPTSGTVLIGGVDLARYPEQARAQIGYLSQRFSLYEDLTVWENIRFFAEMRGLDGRGWQQRALDMLAFVDLAEYRARRAGWLSGGMKQKLGLAVALVTEPAVLLLDEPTTGVDPGTRQDFWQLILKLKLTRRVAVVVSTPYMDEASRCTRIGFMRGGRLLLEGSPRELRDRLTGRVIELAAAPLELTAKAVEKIEGVQTVQRFGDRLHLRVRPGQAERILTGISGVVQAAGGAVSVCRPVEPMLEDVFLSLLEEEL